MHFNLLCELHRETIVQPNLDDMDVLIDVKDRGIFRLPKQLLVSGIGLNEVVLDPGREVLSKGLLHTGSNEPAICRITSVEFATWPFPSGCSFLCLHHPRHHRQHRDGRSPDQRSRGRPLHREEYRSSRSQAEDRQSPSSSCRSTTCAVRACLHPPRRRCENSEPLMSAKENSPSSPSTRLSI